QGGCRPPGPGSGRRRRHPHRRSSRGGDERRSNAVRTGRDRGGAARACRTRGGRPPDRPAGANDRGSPAGAGGAGPPGRVLTPTRPPAAEEIRLLSLSALRGANYWSRAPVTRLDLDVGAYDEISSAEVPSLGDRLRQALPGLSEHRCSVGRRGGFLERLERGTYAPHIIEHVALELQT